VKKHEQIRIFLLVSQAASEVQSSHALSDDDLWMRTALMRQTIAQFLDVWDEYAGLETTKLARFSKTDSEFIDSLDFKIRSSIDETLASIDRTEENLKKCDDLPANTSADFLRKATAAKNNLLEAAARLQVKTNFSEDDFFF
jgi:hypothetical protein